MIFPKLESYTKTDGAYQTALATSISLAITNPFTGIYQLFPMAVAITGIIVAVATILYIARIERLLLYFPLGLLILQRIRMPRSKENEHVLYNNSLKLSIVLREWSYINQRTGRPQDYINRRTSQHLERKETQLELNPIIGGIYAILSAIVYGFFVIYNPLVLIFVLLVIVSILSRYHSLHKHYINSLLIEIIEEKFRDYQKADSQNGIPPLTVADKEFLEYIESSIKVLQDLKQKKDWAGIRMVLEDFEEYLTRFFETYLNTKAIPELFKSWSELLLEGTFTKWTIYQDRFVAARNLFDTDLVHQCSGKIIKTLLESSKRKQVPTSDLLTAIPKEMLTPEYLSWMFETVQSIRQKPVLDWAQPTQEKISIDEFWDNEFFTKLLMLIKDDTTSTDMKRVHANILVSYDIESMWQFMDFESVSTVLELLIEYEPRIGMVRGCLLYKDDMVKNLILKTIVARNGPLAAIELIKDIHKRSSESEIRSNCEAALSKLGSSDEMED